MSTSFDFNCHIKLGDGSPFIENGNPIKLHTLLANRLSMMNAGANITKLYDWYRSLLIVGTLTLDRQDKELLIETLKTLNLPLFIHGQILERLDGNPNT